MRDKDGDLKRKKSDFINEENESEKIPDFICRVIAYKTELVLAAAHLEIAGLTGGKGNGKLCMLLKQAEGELQKETWDSFIPQSYMHAHFPHSSV